MKLKSAFVLSLMISSVAFAGHNDPKDYAKVVRSEPVYEEVSFQEPREECWNETVRYREHNAAAPILGAIIGGAIGHQIGHGSSNRKVGAVVGAGLGAAIASDANSRSRSHQHVEQRCETVYDTQWRREVVGYDVTYRYHGKDYFTRLPYDPGKRLQVNVSVTPAG